MKSDSSLTAWGRRVILGRLARLEKELVRLQQHPDADSIHDTRVAARRLRAALRHLEDVLRPGNAQSMRDEIARLRVLGDIRDIDIIAQSLAPEARRPRSPFQTLLASFARRRLRTLERVAPAAAVLVLKLARWNGRIEATPGADTSRTVREEFHKIYPKLLRRYFRRGRKLVHRQAGAEELHRFRIRTKRMRYVTELYDGTNPAIHATLREIITMSREIQEILGNLQDQSMIVAYFERRLMDVRTPQRQTEYMRVLHRARMRQTHFREAFFRRWARLESMSIEKRWLTIVEKPDVKSNKNN